MKSDTNTTKPVEENDTNEEEEENEVQLCVDCNRTPIVQHEQHCFEHNVCYRCIYEIGCHFCRYEGNDDEDEEDEESEEDPDPEDVLAELADTKH